MFRIVGLTDTYILLIQTKQYNVREHHPKNSSYKLLSMLSKTAQCSWDLLQSQIAPNKAWKQINHFLLALLIFTSVFYAG